MHVVQAVAADDIGRVRAVSVDVDRVGIGRKRAGSGRTGTGPDIPYKIETANHLGSREKIRRRSSRGDGLRRGVVGHIARTAQIVMGVIDPGIEHGDANTLTCKAVVLDGCTAHVGYRGWQVGLRGGRGDLIVGYVADRGEAADILQYPKLAGIDRDDERVVT